MSVRKKGLLRDGIVSIRTGVIMFLLDRGDYACLVMMRRRHYTMCDLWWAITSIVLFCLR